MVASSFRFGSTNTLTPSCAIQARQHQANNDRRDRVGSPAGKAGLLRICNKARRMNTAETQPHLEQGYRYREGDVVDGQRHRLPDLLPKSFAGTDGKNTTDAAGGGPSSPPWGEQ